MKRIKTLTALEVKPGMTIELRSGCYGYVNATCLGHDQIHLIIAGDVSISIGASEAVYLLGE